MLVIGLTGQSGAGKSVVASIMAGYKLPILDADNIYHQLLKSNKKMVEEIVTAFPIDGILQNGEIHRPTLAKAVFSRPDLLTQLNGITHKYVLEEIQTELASLKKRNVEACVLDAPQLFESGANALCSVVLCVLAKEDVRLKRVMFRDGIDKEKALQRLHAQKSESYFVKHGDFLINNNTDSLLELQNQVKDFLTKYGVIK